MAYVMMTYAELAYEVMTYIEIDYCSYDLCNGRISLSTDLSFSPSHDLQFYGLFSYGTYSCG